MSEEINKIFEQWKQFLSWCYENNDKTTEIHRDNLEKVMEYTEKLQNQLQQKENIIKEVREYIENNKQYAELEDYGKNGEYYIDEIGLLEILDKGE